MNFEGFLGAHFAHLSLTSPDETTRAKPDTAEIEALASFKYPWKWGIEVLRKSVCGAACVVCPHAA